MALPGLPGLPGISIPAIPSFNSSATSGSNQNTSGSPISSGAWSVNLGGSGTSNQGASATGGAIPWGMIAVAVVALGALWFFKK